MSLQDAIHLRASNGDDSAPLVVYFISGNPGLIEYYRETMSTVFDQLCTRQPERQIHVCGHSLPGFAIQRSDHPTSGSPPYTLDEEIILIEEQISDTLRRVVSPGTKSANARPRLVLVGHSVGAYILLEILRRQGEGFGSIGQVADVIAGICLFPTIVGIKDSPRGLWISPLLSIPGLATYAPKVLSLLLLAIPSWILMFVLTRILGMPSQAAATSTAFLRSPTGIAQTLHMARFEMLQITQDRWKEDIWEPSIRSSGLPSEGRSRRMLFYWGEDDHWIDNGLRDALIAKRAATSSFPERPVMEIDRHGLPHAFCLSHSRPVAMRIVEFLLESRTK